MGDPRLIVIGASAGGVEAISRVAAQLPQDLAAAVLLVIHFPPSSTSVLPRILERAGPLRAVHATDGEPIEMGRIYVAPPDYHLLVRPGLLRVIRGPKENGVRPAADPLFRSAAYAYGPAVIGVVLSGNLDDGTNGLTVIRQHGGIAVAQDPDDALYPGMPLSALERASPDHVCRLREIAPLLVRLVAEPVPEPPQPTQASMAAGRDEVNDSVLNSLGGLPEEVVEQTPPSPFTCPECHGALWEGKDGDLIQFRCRVGHSFTLDTLLSERSTEVEAALWTALTALEERVDLARRLARRMGDRGNTLLAERYESNARDSAQSARLLRDLLLTAAAPQEISPAD